MSDRADCCVVCDHYLEANTGRWQKGRVLYARSGTTYARVGVACDSHFEPDSKDGLHDGKLRSTEVSRAPRLVYVIQRAIKVLESHEDPRELRGAWLEDARSITAEARVA